MADVVVVTPATIPTITVSPSATVTITATSTTNTAPVDVATSTVPKTTNIVSVGASAVNPISVTYGTPGPAGATGPSGVISASSPVLYNTGTKNVSLDQTLLSISPSQVTGTAAVLTGATFTGTISAPTVSGTTASFTATGTFNQIIATNINATNFYATNFGTAGSPASTVNAITVTATTVTATTVNVSLSSVVAASPSLTPTLTLPPVTGNIANVPVVTATQPTTTVVGTLWVDTGTSTTILGIDGGSAL